MAVPVLDGIPRKARAAAYLCRWRAACCDDRFADRFLLSVAKHTNAVEGILIGGQEGGASPPASNPDAMIMSTSAASMARASSRFLRLPMLTMPNFLHCSGYRRRNTNIN